MVTPFPYQQEGRAFMTARPFSYLADDPGLGKTLQFILAADDEEADRVLVLCPASLKANWAREFAKFSSRRRPVVIINAEDSRRGPPPIPRTGPLLCIVNYDLVIRPELHRALCKAGWDRMGWDEGHALKTPASTRTRAVLGGRGLYRHAPRITPLSGTPAPNHVGELYPVLCRLYPKATRGMNYDTWLAHYCTVIPGAYGPKVMGNKPTIWRLKQDLEGFLLRRRRSEVLTDLPELRTGVLTVENDEALAHIEREHTEEYAEIRALLGAEEEEVDLELVDDMALATMRRLYGEAKARALLPLIVEELESGVNKIVLMCWHRRTMDILQEGLAEYGVARIDGTTKDHQREVDAFQGTVNTTACRVFVGQIISAGTGHTLTAAQHMIIVEPSWVPGENFQAMLRIHRIGQMEGCLVRYAALAGSIDEAIMATTERKARALAEVFS